jgi:hypothetical protein
VGIEKREFLSAEAEGDSEAERCDRGPKRETPRGHGFLRKNVMCGSWEILVQKDATYPIPYSDT